jgi:hypothetical protein
MFGQLTADLMWSNTGIGLIYLVLQSTTWVLSKKLGFKGLNTGQYGNPPSAKYWARQAAVYVFALTAMKLLVVALFALWPSISTVGDWLLSWTSIGDGESFQVILCVSLFGYMQSGLTRCLQRHGHIPYHNERSSVLAHRLYR